MTAHAREEPCRWSRWSAASWGVAGAPSADTIIDCSTSLAPEEGPGGSRGEGPWAGGREEGRGGVKQMLPRGLTPGVDLAVWGVRLPLPLTCHRRFCCSEFPRG